jgi:hypothetical protein
MPLARPGFWADGSADICSAPHGRISFANQDCLLNPAIEACLNRAEAAEAFVRPLMA